MVIGCSSERIWKSFSSGDGSNSTNGSDNEPAELTYVDMDTLLATL